MIFSMTSSKPYLIRALYEWIVDNECIPHIMVDTHSDEVNVPEEFIEDGKIILDISPEAIKDLVINNDHIEFRARFSRSICYISFPTEQVVAIYNEEGIGMFFDDDEESEILSDLTQETSNEKGSLEKNKAPLASKNQEKSLIQPKTKDTKSKKPSDHSHLKIVK